MPSTLWLARIRIPGEPKLRAVRISTTGNAPTPDDPVEEIPDPFEAAQPDRGAAPDADAAELAQSLPPVPGGVTAPLGELEIAAPVRPGKIVCVGRNYRAHAQEMGNEVPDEPLLFFKPSSALLGANAPIVRPSGYERVDMEAELVVVIGRTGRGLSAEQALDHVAGYTLGNDVSCRNLQRRDKQWTRAKGFDTFAPLGPFVRIVAPGDGPPASARIQGSVDGERRQDAPLSDMIFDIPTVLAYVADVMTLQPGDVVYTGTPAGVSALEPGCTCAVELSGWSLGRLQNSVVGPPLR